MVAGAGRYRQFDREQLTTPLSEVDTSVLTQGEWRSVRFHRIASLGGVISMHGTDERGRPTWSAGSSTDH